MKTYDRKLMKAARVYLGLTQEDIAKEMCTTKQTISNVESGKSVSTMTLEFYERVLREKMDYDIFQHKINWIK